MTKSKLKFTGDLKTMKSCRNTTDSIVKATNGSGLYLHKDNETK